MQKRKLGHSNLEISALGLGGMGMRRAPSYQGPLHVGLRGEQCGRAWHPRPELGLAPEAVLFGWLAA